MSPSYAHDDQVGSRLQSKLNNLLIGLADTYCRLRHTAFARLGRDSFLQALQDFRGFTFNIG